MLLTLVSTLLGLALIGVALRDVFHTLFHPSGASSLNRLLASATWRAVRWIAARRPDLLVLAGPSALVVVIASWVVLVATGWAFIYWPRLPDEFLVATGLNLGTQDGFLTALYVSIVTLATLGYGDITPTDGWLRILAPLEAMVGFVLLTAGISWVLSIYPTLARRRALAREVTLLREAASSTDGTMPAMEGGAGERLLSGLTTQLIGVRGDLSQFPITYYFHSGDGRAALSTTLPYLQYLAEQGSHAACPSVVRLQAAMLRGALDDLAHALGSRFLGLPSAPADRVFAAYARDHQRDVQTGVAPGSFR